MSNTKIPAGYRITVKSWENDADSRQTVIVEGMTKERAAFYADICKNLNSCNDQKKPGIGNLYEPDDKELGKVNKVFSKIIEKHRDYLTSDLDLGEEEDPDDLSDYMFEHLSELGLGGCSDFYTRVCDSWTIEYVPHEIMMKDVTKEFK